ncbi:uncharacterized protein LOC144632128 isoform X2 [Oculina patagonica]
MGIREQDVTVASRNMPRGYSDRSDVQRPHPWEREKRDELSRSWGGERTKPQPWEGERGDDLSLSWGVETRNKGHNDKSQLMNGPTPSPNCKKYISVVSEGNYFIASKAPLPDRIELRMCGTTGIGQNNRTTSIPDLYRVKMKPIPEVVEEQVDAVRREEVHLENACPLHDHLSRSGSLKEMYVSQYTHHFDSDGPRSHIAGWKVDIEPNNIPHRRSRMCVLNNPMISGSRKRPERPKSAPPTLAYEFDAFTEDIEDDRLSCATLPNFHQGFPDSARSTDDIATRLQELMVDASPPDFINDDSSFGYDPSDDTSETSSAFYHDQSSYRKRDPSKFSYSRPKLIRLSADFPGVRNLEKMRRKRKSMGSSSTGSTSPSLSPSGEYGFFVALTSKDQVPQQRHGRYYSMT